MTRCPPRATLAPRSTYRGPSGRIDGPEETQYAAELAVLRARSEEPEPRLEPVPEEEPLEPLADRDVLRSRHTPQEPARDVVGDGPDRVEGERE
jgi:hypothetical protein